MFRAVSLPETCTVSRQNKFAELVRLLVLLIRLGHSFGFDTIERSATVWDRTPNFLFFQSIS